MLLALRCTAHSPRSEKKDFRNTLSCEPPGLDLTAAEDEQWAVRGALNVALQQQQHTKDPARAHRPVHALGLFVTERDSARVRLPDDGVQHGIMHSCMVTWCHALMHSCMVCNKAVTRRMEGWSPLRGTPESGI